MKPIVNYGLSDSLIDAVRKSVEEGKGDGNLANNAKPYNKITRGDVIAGRLGNDEKGGKTTINTNPKLKEEEYEQMDEKYRRGGNPGPSTRQRAAILNKMKPLDPNATVIYKDGVYSSSKGYPHRDQLKDHIHKESGHKVMIPSTTNNMHDAATGAKIATDVYSGKHTAGSLVRAVKKFHKEEYEQMDEASAQDIVARLKKKHNDGNYRVGPGGEVTHPYLEKDSIDRRIAALKEEDEQIDELDASTLKRYTDVAGAQARWAGGVAKALGAQRNSSRPEESKYRESNVTDPKADYGPEGNKYAKLSQKRAAGAAKARKRLGETYKISREEDEQMDEGRIDDLMDKRRAAARLLPAAKSIQGNVTKNQGTRYGGSAQPPDSEEDDEDPKGPRQGPLGPKGPRSDKGLTRKRRFNTKSYDKIKGRLDQQAK